jgi:antitoxin (DNA-binding transcriptional repressor) of toxin-antitoxin stability system
MDEVARTGEPILVTKNGKPVAELRPHRPRRRTLRGAWKGRAAIRGDIVAPLDADWDASR